MLSRRGREAVLIDVFMCMIGQAELKREAGNWEGVICLNRDEVEMGRIIMEVTDARARAYSSTRFHVR